MATEEKMTLGVGQSNPLSSFGGKGEPKIDPPLRRTGKVRSKAKKQAGEGRRRRKEPRKPNRRDDCGGVVVSGLPPDIAQEGGQRNRERERGKKRKEPSPEGGPLRTMCPRGGKKKCMVCVNSYGGEGKRSARRGGRNPKEGTK